MKYTLGRGCHIRPHFSQKVVFFIAVILFPVAIVGQVKTDVEAAARVATVEKLFGTLPKEQRALLVRGEVLVRSPKNALDPEIAGLKDVAAIDPNYLVEAISVLPKEGSEDALRRLSASLANVEGYPRIRFFSKRWGHDFPLFESLKIKARVDSADGVSLDALTVMDPLIPGFNATYSLGRSDGRLEFSSRNQSAVLYKSVQVIKTGQMIWRITAFVDGGSLVFFSVGAARVFDLFGSLRDRLEPAFNGRAQAFFQFMHGELSRKGE